MPKFGHVAPVREGASGIGDRPLQAVPTIQRPRLEGLIKEAATRRLTAIVAGPGFGKTTTLTRVFGSGPVAWHTATPLDATFPVFARNVVDRIRLRVPDLAADVLRAVSGPTGPDLDDHGARVETLAAALAQDLDTRLGDDLVLVLDDVDEVTGSEESSRFLAALARNAPPRLHLVTASRRPLPFATARMRVAGDAVELGPEDLAFEVEEISELLEAVSGRSDRETALDLIRRTGGWPVAVVLMLRRMGQSRAAGPGQVTEVPELLDYLSEELLMAEDPGTVATLRKAALLPWVTRELAEAIGVASEVFDAAGQERTRPYLTRPPDVPNAVAVAPLIRDFLDMQAPIARDEREAILSAAAPWYAAAGWFVEALTCHRLLARAEDAFTFLGDHGEAMLVRGLARPILSLLEELVPTERPDMRLLEAEARQILGDWEGAMKVYLELVPDSGELAPGLAWRLGFLQHMRGDVGAALQTYRQGRLDTGDTTSEAILLGWTAAAHWLRGERDQAKERADRALTMARQADDPRALATAHTVLAMVAALDGDRAGNDTHYLRALEHAERASDVLQTIRIRSNRGSHFLEEGDFGPALAELEIAIRLADMTGFELWRAMALSNRGQIHAAQGRLEEAIADLRQARGIFRRIGSSFEAYPLAHLGVVYGLRGDAVLARGAYEEAIRLAEDPHDLQALIPALSGLAQLIADEDPDRAAEMAARAAEVEEVIGHVSAVTAVGVVSLARGRRDEAAEHARSAIELARARRDLPGLADALELAGRSSEGDVAAVHHLEEARRVWGEVGAPIASARVGVLLAERKGGVEGIALATAAARELERLGAKGPGLDARRVAERLSRVELPLEVKTLGGFEVIVEGAPVPVSAWQSRVAREILAMLIAARGRPIHRETLIDRIWPDEDLAKASNRLSVALTTIRNVLDPGRSGDATEYLVADRETVSLAVDRMSLDIERFLTGASKGLGLVASGRGEEGLALLATTETLYVGDFLEEYPYVDWAVGLREEAGSVYVSVASTLARADIERGDHDAATRHYLRILERDPYNERAHLDLIRVVTGSGRHGTARRLYSSYVSRMAELEIEPEPFPS